MANILPELLPGIKVGPVELTVSDLERLTDFYVTAIGLHVHRREGRSASLGVGGEDLLILHGEPSAPRPTGPTTGLFHTAFLLPSRADLAAALGNLVDRNVQLHGAADHLVSEALYLADPDGNGIEIYRDRSREQWTWREGQIHMTTEPLDLDRLFAERGAKPPSGAFPAGTVIGHVHLRVADIAAVEAFYRDGIGLALTARYGRSASFLAAGGYHHHVGINTWSSLNAPTPRPGSVGLRSFHIRLPDQAELAKVTQRLGDAGYAVESIGGGALVRDPSGNAVVLAVD